MTTDDSVVDVLIAGAGPTGTALAIDLVRRGLRVRIVDKAPHSFEGSRAKGLQPRTLEVLDDLGVTPVLLAQGSLYPKLGIHIGPAVLPWSMMKNRDATPEEFESNELNREKIVTGNGTITILLGPLEPGRYPFFGDFHQETAQGVLIAK